MANPFPKDAVKAAIVQLATMAGNNAWANLPSTNVIWEGDTIPFIAPKGGGQPVQGTLKLKVSKGAKLGRDDETRTYNVDGTTTITYSGPRQYTLTVKSMQFGGEAVDVLDELGLFLESQYANALFNAAGLAIVRVLDTNDISGGGNNALAALGAIDILVNGNSTRSVTFTAEQETYIQSVASLTFEEPDDD